MSNEKRRYISMWLSLCFLMLCAFGFSVKSYGSQLSDTATGKQRVFDRAGLLSEDEIEDLEEQVFELREALQMDIVLVTTNDANGKSSRDFADDFYDYGGFGYGKKYNGALFLIDMDNREIYIATTGKMIRYLTDKRIETILDHAYEQIANENYYETMNTFLNDLKYYIEKGIVSGQYNYDTKTGRISIHLSIRWYEALFAVVVAGIMGFLPCMSVINSYRMKERKQKKQVLNYQMAYRAQCKFAYNVNNDLFINKFVSQKRIPRNTSSGGGSVSGRSGGGGRSSTHRSSSGRSHGGGGRKF